MGWVAHTGLAGVTLEAMILPLFMFSWQFPHFNALSWKYRPDYSRAGYVMMSVTDTAMSRRVALKHSLLQLFYSIPAYLFLLPNSFFLLLSLVLNGYMFYQTKNFYKNPASAATKLFQSSLISLPILMAILFLFLSIERGYN